MARTRNQKTAAKPGLVIWITGLPGAGKTVIAKALAELLRDEKANSIVVLDGDELRLALGSGDQYQPHQRLALGKSYGRLSRLLANQEHTVICATVCMFDEIRFENRSESTDYFEVFLVADAAIRASRKPQIVSLSNGVSAGDASYQLPQTSDLIIENLGDRSPSAVAKIIFDRLRER